MNNNEVYACPKCGSDVNINSRCCMKCGCLNPYHVQNIKYEQYMNTSGNYSVSGGSVQSNNDIKNDTNIKSVSIGLGNKMGNFTICFIVNLLIYIVLIGLVVFLLYSNSNHTLNGFLGTNIYYIILGVTVISLFNYSQQLVYMKMNKHWILSLIPIVNLYTLSDAINNKKLLNLLVFVPVVGSVYCLVLIYQLGKAFKKSGLLTLLFPLIMFPVIGFGGSAFRGVCYINNNDTLEKEFSKKKGFLKVAGVVSICSIIMMIYANIAHIDSGFNQGLIAINKAHMYYSAKKVMRRTKIKVETKTYSCDGSNNTLYFHFNDLSDYFSIPFYVFRRPIEGYVRVDIDETDNFIDYYTYYISFTDGIYGFPETKFEELDMSSIVEYPILYYDSSLDSCYFNLTT